MKKDRRRKITLTQREEIIRRRRAGEATLVLALDHGISRKTVYEICQTALRPRAKLSRRQLNSYLKLLGHEPPNVQTILGAAPVIKRPAKRAAPRLGEITWKNIIRRHAAGEKVSVLAEEFGITRAGLYVGINRRKDGLQSAVTMTLEHLQWLEQKLMPAGRPGRKRWAPMEVRRMLKEKFGKHISLRTFHSQLRWMGVGPPAKPSVKRREVLQEMKKTLTQQNERLVLEALSSGKIQAVKRGRRKTAA